MSTVDASLYRRFEFACEFTRMDAVFTDTDHAMKWRSITCHIPAPLQSYFETLRERLPLHITERESNILLHPTSFHLHFITAPFFNAGRLSGHICVGPFLLEVPSSALINEIAFTNRLPVGLLPMLTAYYQSLPLISQDKTTLISNFLAHLTAHFDEGRSHTSKPPTTSTYHLQNQHAILPDTIKHKTTEAIVSKIEQRYLRENRMMALIAGGNVEKLEVMLQKFQPHNGEIPDRIPNNPLRSRKNLAFVLNTLLRKAAEKGGLHPVYIDSLSEKFAIQIEKTTSVQQLLDLRKHMHLEYCEAVRKLSLSNWSPLIQRTMAYVRLHIHKELRLETIARAVHTSPSELSRQFKQETKQSLTSFINKQRVQEALLLMENERMTITAIAQMVGYNDVNYFTKVFKQLKGCTPSQYRKETWRYVT